MTLIAVAAFFLVFQLCYAPCSVLNHLTCIIQILNANVATGHLKTVKLYTAKVHVTHSTVECLHR